MSAFSDGGLSELFEGVPVPVPLRYRGEREPELQEAGAIGQVNLVGRTQEAGFGQKRTVATVHLDKQPFNPQSYGFGEITSVD
jgi:hypothetical protein